MTTSPFPLAHPCNCAGSHRESVLSRKMEADQCRARGQHNAFLIMAAELIDVLATKALTHTAITRDEAMQARKVAKNLRDYV